MDNVGIFVLRHPLSDLDVVRRYRYQLEAFVDKVRGRTPEHWYDAQDSITNMEWIEAVYKEVGRLFLLQSKQTEIFHRLGWDPDLGRQPRCRDFSREFVGYIMQLYNIEMYSAVPLSRFVLSLPSSTRVALVSFPAK